MCIFDIDKPVEKQKMPRHQGIALRLFSILMLTIVNCLVLYKTAHRASRGYALLEFVSIIIVSVNSNGVVDSYHEQEKAQEFIYPPELFIIVVPCYKIYEAFFTY